MDGSVRLTQRFFERNGVSMVLNISFNETESIACTPRQALDCFLRTRAGLQAVRPGRQHWHRQLAWPSPLAAQSGADAYGSHQHELPLGSCRA